MSHSTRFRQVMLPRFSENRRPNLGIGMPQPKTVSVAEKVAFNKSSDWPQVRHPSRIKIDARLPGVKTRVFPWRRPDRDRSRVELVRRVNRIEVVDQIHFHIAADLHHGPTGLDQKPAVELARRVEVGPDALLFAVLVAGHFLQGIRSLETTDGRLGTSATSGKGSSGININDDNRCNPAQHPSRNRTSVS